MYHEDVVRVLVSVMSTMIGPRKGIIRGKFIELVQPTTIPDGSEVNVSIETARKVTGNDLEAFRSVFGALADQGHDLDQFLEWNRQQRKQSRP